MRSVYLGICLILLIACSNSPLNIEIIKPSIVTDTTQYDSDDPAIWYNLDNPEESLVLGTDKEIGGGLMVFNIDGKLLKDKSIYGLARPNNVDVEYGLKVNDSVSIDIAVTVERPKELVRIYGLPAMKALDNGGFPVFQMEQDSMDRWPMGVALYKNRFGEISMILSRKTGPTDGSYLWQYSIKAESKDSVSIALIRKFGQFSGGEGEIEAIMVDDSLGFVYYSDELFGIRKYFADPEKGNEELAVFGQKDFKRDREGIALWPTSTKTGYILISDQQQNAFNIYPRNPEDHKHSLITKLYLSTMDSDGCELFNKPFGENFPKGFFIAMSTDKTFHYYDLRDLELQINRKH